MSSDIIGRQFANFRIMRHLGHGGMADVYYGHDLALQRPVAIKVLDERHRHDPAYAKRFLREAQSVATWRHDNIVQVFYAAEEEELSYFVMEYIDGKDLAATLNRRRKLMPYDEVIRIGRSVANALDYAHGQGVIHRDVKPANVMVAKDGRVILMDFGLALDMNEGSRGEVFGSANYVSPEQARNSAEAVPQSDVYSLGVMLYEMLVGRLPFDDPSFTTVAIQHITTPPPPPRELNPNLSEATETVLLKALHKSPEKRYRTAGALIDALEKALQAPAPAGAATVTPTQSRRSSTRATAGAKVTAAEPAKKSPTRATSAAKRAVSGTNSAKPSDPAVSSARRSRKTTPPPAPVEEPAGPPLLASVDDTQALYKRMGLVAGVVVGVLLFLLLLLWLFSNGAEAALWLPPRLL